MNELDQPESPNLFFFVFLSISTHYPTVCLYHLRLNFIATKTHAKDKNNLIYTHHITPTYVRSTHIHT